MDIMNCRQHKFSWFPIFVRQFRNPLFFILVVAAIVDGFFDITQSLTITVIIAISVILGFYYEYKAEDIINDLRRSVSLKAVVLRDGKPTEVDSRLVVPGDVASVYVGDIVPADMRITESKETEVNESLLTGESFPAEKAASPITLAHPTPQQLSNHLFMGTVVVHGSGRRGSSSLLGSILSSGQYPAA